MNINVTPEFQRNLKLVMKARNAKEKTAVLRDLVAEAAAQIRELTNGQDFRQLLGIGFKSKPDKRKLLTEDDLWS